MTSKQRHTWKKRYILGQGHPWLDDGFLAGLLTLRGNQKRLVRPPAVDRFHYWRRPQYRLILERVK